MAKGAVKWFNAEKGFGRFRGNCFFEAHGIAAAFRLIPTYIRSVDELNLPLVLKEIVRKRRGLFLVTGPTGHGKSTKIGRAHV